MLDQAPSMPDHPSYLPQLAGILAEARAAQPIPFFRRRDIEALFGAVIAVAKQWWCCGAS